MQDVEKMQNYENELEALAQDKARIMFGEFDDAVTKAAAYRGWMQKRADFDRRYASIIQAENTERRLADRIREVQRCFPAQN